MAYNDFTYTSSNYYFYIQKLLFLYTNQDGGNNITCLNANFPF